MDKDPILITGCARSRTSMVAGIINFCGAWGGVMSKPNRNNPKGMFENYEIRNTLLKPYLSSIGADRLGQFPLPNIKKIDENVNIKNKVKKIIFNQGYTSGAWMYKGAKLCLIWPIWHYNFPEAYWIIVRRKTDGIINSCLHTSFMRAFKNKNIQNKVNVKNQAEGWRWWIEQHKKRFKEMHKAELKIKEIWTDNIVAGDYREIKNLVEELSLKWDHKKVMNFVILKEGPG